jgi:hypothetical protein
MAATAAGQFEVTSWVEEPVYESGGAMKITRASVAQRYTGDVDGEGQVEYIMAYLEDGTATFVRVERFEGRIQGRAGSLILQGGGAFDGTEAGGEWNVVPGSAEGELAGLSGTGRFRAPHGMVGSYTLEYHFG